MAQLGHGNLHVGINIINAMIIQQPYQIGFNELFYALGWIFFGLMGLSG